MEKDNGSGEPLATGTSARIGHADLGMRSQLNEAVRSPVGSSDFTTKSNSLHRGRQEGPLTSW